MSKADALRAEYEQALAVAELEDELVRLKEEPGDGKRLREVKHQLRAARRAQRTAREGN